MGFKERWATWAPTIARIIFGAFFLYAASQKVPGSGMFAIQVAESMVAGLPLPTLAVVLAFFFELVVGFCLLLGWHTRLAAGLAVPYIALLALIFHHDFGNPTELGFFVDHITLIAGLLVLSGVGARAFALKKDA